MTSTCRLFITAAAQLIWEEALVAGWHGLLCSGGRTARAQAFAAYLIVRHQHHSLHSSCFPLFAVPPRSDDIVRWIKKRTGPATVEVADAEALEKAQKENKVGGWVDWELLVLAGCVRAEGA